MVAIATGDCPILVGLHELGQLTFTAKNCLACEFENFSIGFSSKKFAGFQMGEDWIFRLVRFHSGDLVKISGMIDEIYGFESKMVGPNLNLGSQIPSQHWQRLIVIAGGILSMWLPYYQLRFLAFYSGNGETYFSRDQVIETWNSSTWNRSINMLSKTGDKNTDIPMVRAYTSINLI